jgi:hypothetical protein
MNIKIDLKIVSYDRLRVLSCSRPRLAFSDSSIICCATAMCFITMPNFLEN